MGPLLQQHVIICCQLVKPHNVSPDLFYLTIIFLASHKAQVEFFLLKEHLLGLLSFLLVETKRRRVEEMNSLSFPLSHHTYIYKKVRLYIR